MGRDAQWCSVVDAVVEHARANGDAPAIFFRAGGAVQEVWTRADLDAGARAWACRIRAHVRAGRRVVLMLPNGPDFVRAFVGCLYGAVIAVPVAPPEREGHVRSVGAVVEDCRAALILTSADVCDRLPGDLRQLAWVPEPIEAGDAAAWERPTLEPRSIAMLQYTSGSTAQPRGVVVEHGNLLHNLRFIARRFGYGPDSVSVSWLPFHHDMGLLDGLLQPLVRGFPLHRLDPHEFLRHPRSWLQALGDARASHSGGPNFAYELCLHRIPDEALGELNLSHWAVAYNGAEPVRASTLRAFAARFAACGFRWRSFVPCYGLAESTLMVTGGSAKEPPRVFDFAPRALELEGRARRAAGSGRPIVGCGHPDEEAGLAIVDPDRRRLPDGYVGEIWVSGASVARSYWGGTEDGFGASLHGESERAWLRTGDLGFVLDQELFITGRRRDLLVVRGRNIHPHDLEQSAAGCHPDLRPGCAAAFSVLKPDCAEQLVLVHEVRSARDAQAAAEAIWRAVAAEQGVALDLVALVPPRSVPKTTSGKVRRGACRQRWSAGELEEVLRFAGPDHEVDREVMPAAPDARGLVESCLHKLLGPAIEFGPKEPTLAALGLDSLATISLEARLETLSGRSLGPILPTHRVADVVQVLEQAPRQSAIERPGKDEVAFRPTRLTEALWLADTAPESRGPLQVALAVRLHEKLDRERVEDALALLAQRHPMLRSCFVPGESGELEQRVLAADVVGLGTERGPWADDADQRRHIADCAVAPFDLAKRPPVRFTLFADGEKPPVLLISAHHLAVDLGSAGVLLRELCALLADGPQVLPPPPVSPAELACREAARLLEGRSQAQIEWWQRTLAGTPAVTSFHPDAGPWRSAHEPRVASRALSPQTVRAVCARARALGQSPFSLFLSALVALLHRHNGRLDQLVGAVASCRDYACARAVGCLVNLLPVRVRWPAGASTDDLLRLAARALHEALLHRDLPFPEIVRNVQPPRLAGHAPLIQNVITQASWPGIPDALGLGCTSARFALSGMELQSVPLPQAGGVHELTWMIGQLPRGMAIAVHFDAAGWAESRIRALLEDFTACLDHLVHASALRPRSLPAAERALVTREWSGRSQRPRAALGSNPVEMIREQARHRPAATALTSAGQTLTYSQLVARAAAFAVRLREAGVGPDVVVGLAVRRDADWVVGLLAILWAGGVYLPLDLDYPRRRLELMLREGGARLVVAARGAIPWTPLPVVQIRPEAQLDSSGPATPPAEIHPEQLAYIMFTSGSTGAPKAVGVPYRGLLSLMAWAREHHPPAVIRRVAAATSQCFDVSLFELLAPLSVGGSVLLVGDVLELASVPDVSLVCAVPSAAAALLDNGGLPRDLQVIQCAGERLTAALADRLHAAGVEVHDLYGPTETTVYATFARRGASGAETVGRVIAGACIHVLDEASQPVAAGMPGEICIGGERIARGYLGRPGATAERFVPDPFSAEPGARLYRTGDRGCFLPSGDLLFLGRQDRQVKVRGFRVQPEEVERELLRLARVSEAAVVPYDDGVGGGLAAFVTGAPDLAVRELRRRLQQRLPAHLVPQLLEVRDELPRLPTGKIDRRALGAAGGDASAQSFSTLEQRVADMWAEVLGVRPFHPRQDFFELGGHSLLCVQLAGHIHRELQVELSFADLYSARTAAQQAEVIRSRRAIRESQIPRARPLAPVDVRSLSDAEVDALLEGVEGTGK